MDVRLFLKRVHHGLLHRLHYLPNEIAFASSTVGTSEHTIDANILVGTSNWHLETKYPDNIDVIQAPNLFPYLNNNTVDSVKS